VLITKWDAKVNVKGQVYTFFVLKVLFAISSLICKDRIQQYKQMVLWRFQSVACLR